MMPALLLSLALKGAVVLALGTAAAFALRAAPAAFRHSVWAATFSALLLLPVLDAAVPAWRVGVLPSTDQTVATCCPVSSSPSASSDLAEAPPRAIAVPAAKPMAESPAHPEPAGTNRAAGTPSWWTVLGVLWMLGVLAVGGVWLRAFALARRLVAAASPVQDAPFLALAATAARKAGLARPVRLLRSDDLGVPVAWGYGRPAVLLPPTADGWDSDRREAVLLHEMAHISRRDAWTQLVAQIALALYWPNPLTWMAYRRFMDAREQACDDAVLRVGATPTGYASHLVAVARELSPSRLTLAAVAPMAARSELETRILSVLDSGRQRGPLGWRALLATVAAVLLIGVPLAALQPVPAEADAAPRHTVAFEQVADQETIHERQASPGGEVAATDTIPPPEVVAAALRAAARDALRTLRAQTPNDSPADDAEWEALENRVLSGISADVAEYAGSTGDYGPRFAGLSSLQARLRDLKPTIQDALRGASHGFRAGFSDEEIEREIEQAWRGAERDVEHAQRDNERAERDWERAQEAIERHQAEIEHNAERHEAEMERNAERLEAELERNREQLERRLEQAEEQRARHLEQAQEERERQQERMRRDAERSRREATGSRGSQRRGVETASNTLRVAPARPQAPISGSSQAKPAPPAPPVPPCAP